MTHKEEIEIFFEKALDNITELCDEYGVDVEEQLVELKTAVKTALKALT